VEAALALAQLHLHLLPKKKATLIDLVTFFSYLLASQLGSTTRIDVPIQTSLRQRDSVHTRIDKDQSRACMFGRYSQIIVRVGGGLYD